MLADRNSKGGRQNRFCLSVTLQQRQTIMHYQHQKSSAFLRITVATPNLVTQTRGLISQSPTAAQHCSQETLMRMQMNQTSGQHYDTTSSAHACHVLDAADWKIGKQEMEGQSPAPSAVECMCAIFGFC